jgi:hypothetical protein
MAGGSGFGAGGGLCWHAVRGSKISAAAATAFEEVVGQGRESMKKILTIN